MIVDREIISKIEAKALVAYDEYAESLVQMIKKAGELKKYLYALMEDSDFKSVDDAFEETSVMVKKLGYTFDVYKEFLENILCECGLVISSEDCKYCILCQDEEITRETNDCGCEKCNHIQKVRIKQEKQRLMRLEKEKLKIDPSH